jgi:hypothetical protein
MFSSISKEIYSFFSSMPEFTSVMKRMDGAKEKIFLFPIVAMEGNSLPLTTYYLDDRTYETKDRTQLQISVMFWFDQNSYDSCCEFADIMIEKIDGIYDFVSSKIEYNEESFTYSAIVNFKLL